MMFILTKREAKEMKTQESARNKTSKRQNEKFSRLSCWRVNQINKGLLEELVALLKPLKDLRMKMCKDDEPTFHLVAMSYVAIWDMMETSAEKVENAAIVLLKHRFRKYMKEKYDVHDLHIIATFLCPLYSRNFKFSDTTNVKSAMDTLGQLLNECTESDNEADQADNQPLSVRNSMFDKYMDNDRSKDSSGELERFKSMLFADNHLTCCPLQFWSNQKKSFPKLSKIALWILSAPATNSSSERAFSAAGNTVTPHRNTSKPMNVEQLLFLKSNKDMID